MSVWVAEVAGVDPPRPVVGLVRESCAGRFGLREHSVDVGLTLDEVSDAELARLGCFNWDVGVLRQFGARVEGKDEAAVELEHGDGTAGVVTSPLNSVPVALGRFYVRRDRRDDAVQAPFVGDARRLRRGYLGALFAPTDQQPSATSTAAHGRIIQRRRVRQMIEASCLREADGDSLVVETDAVAFHLALSELFFEEQSGRYIRRFPARTLSDEIFRRFQSRLEPLLRQTARLETAPWQEALRETARRLDGAGVDWGLTGSAALADAATAFDDALIEPAVAVEDWFCRWWGRAWIGARVEWVGGVTEAADTPLATDFGLVAAASLSRIRWNGLTILVPPLELQRAVSERRGLTERVRLIDALG